MPWVSARSQRTKRASLRLGSPSGGLHILSAITVSLISRLSFCSVNLRDLSGLERNWTTCNSMEIGSVGVPAHTLA